MAMEKPGSLTFVADIVTLDGRLVTCSQRARDKARVLSIPRAFVLALVRKLCVITSRACARQRGFFLKEFVSPNLGGAPVVR